MKKILVILPNDEKREISAQGITERYASDVCDKNGWGYRSPAWYDLAKWWDVSDEFLIEQAKKMYPGARIELKDLTTPERIEYEN